MFVMGHEFPQATFQDVLSQPVQIVTHNNRWRPAMIIKKSLSHNTVYHPRVARAPQQPAENHNNSNVGPALMAVGGLALGAGMIFQDPVNNALESFGTAIGPTLDAIVPVVAGLAAGGIAGAVTGAVIGAVATAGEHDATPVIAVIQGTFGGVALGALTGGISVALGATPLLAIPAVIIGAAAMKYF